MTMITAIFTDQATLTIDISDDELTLVQMGSNKSFDLTRGTNKVPVGAGVFRVLSEAAVHVTTDTPHLYVAFTTNSKDSGFPNPPKSVVPIDPTTLHQFFVDSKGESIP
jgi:hypothetical protein